MLNGQSHGVDFEIEFAQIARIEKSGRGAVVTLKDGRSFELSGSNDVNDENRGIVVDTGDGVRKVRWEDFRELRLERLTTDAGSASSTDPPGCSRRVRAAPTASWRRPS